jgi:hypothetical protein
VRDQRTLRRLAGSCRNREPIVHTDAGDPQNPVSGADIAFDAGGYSVGSCGNVTRLQRACKGSE